MALMGLVLANFILLVLLGLSQAKGQGPKLWFINGIQTEGKCLEELTSLHQPVQYCTSALKKLFKAKTS